MGLYSRLMTYTRQMVTTPEGHKGHRKAAKGGRVLEAQGPTLWSTWTAVDFYLVLITARCVL